MVRELMVDRLMRETHEADKIRDEMRDKPALDRLIEAAARSIRANSDYPVGKDGKTRLSIWKISAEGDMAGALREMGKLE